MNNFAPGVFIDLINKEHAERAYHGTSFSPENRGESARRSFVNCMQVDWELISKLADRDMSPEFAKHLKRSIQLYNSWLSARGQCYSTMITGLANFNVTRSNKRNHSERLRYEEFDVFRKKSIKRLTKTEQPFGDGSVIYSDDPEALTLLKGKLTKLEELQATMKTANKIIRSKHGVSARLSELGFSEKSVIDLLQQGNYGFASYSLTNNNAKIKSTRARIEALTKQLAKTHLEPFTFEGGTVEVDTDANRVRIYYDLKPDLATRTMLKSKAFKWAPSVGAWQRQITNNAIYAAELILTIEMAEAYI